jgi:hypothetical protein
MIISSRPENCFKKKHLKYFICFSTEDRDLNYQGNCHCGPDPQSPTKVAVIVGLTRNPAGMTPCIELQPWAQNQINISRLKV